VVLTDDAGGDGFMQLSACDGGSAEEVDVALYDRTI
jgi:hypothetical protein